MLGDVTYYCQQAPEDKLVVNLYRKVNTEPNTAYVAVLWAGVPHSMVLSSEDALDLARRINEAFGA